MAAKTSWHRYGTKVRYRHPMYYRWCRRPGVLTHPINQQSPWQRRTCVTWPRSLPVTWPPRRRRHWRRSGAVPRGAGDGVLFHGVLSVCLSVVAGRTGRCDVTRELRRRRLRSLPTPSLTTTTIVRRLRRRRRRRRRRQTGRQTGRQADRQISVAERHWHFFTFLTFTSFTRRKREVDLKGRWWLSMLPRTD